MHSQPSVLPFAQARHGGRHMAVLGRALLPGLFFGSGAAALIYQIGWQRILFAAFGIDLQSITIVVSTFMLGLGLGALIGGAVADRWPRHLLLCFAVGEAVIGGFGAVSAGLLTMLGDLFVHASLPVVAAVNFVALLIPTTVMGATLPILVAWNARKITQHRGGTALQRAVGVTTASLYRANTLGAALGAGGAGFVIFAFLELDQALLLAAGINVAVALVALVALRRQEAGA